jgi:hypothetical protein
MEHEKYFQYFDRAVLNFYRTNSHAYTLLEDDMGGEIRVSRQWDESIGNQFPYIELKFAFRKLVDKVICIGVFMPSFKDKVSEKDYSKWIGFHIKEPKFHIDNFEFDRWVNRYINGSWEVDDGPKIQIERELKLINALTQIKYNLLFFKHDEYKLVNYPIAENSEEYTKAVLELYRLIIDGMNQDPIIQIARFLNITLTDEKKKLNSFKEILPQQHINNIYNPINAIYQKRMPIHGIPSNGIVSFPAFEAFNSDLKSLSIAFIELRTWLETIFNLSAESCLKRLEDFSLFPKLNKPPNPEFKFLDALRMVGKQIEEVEFGETKFHKEAHLSEAINIYFTDGTAVTIRIGSNAYNLACEYKNFKPSDIHTDIMLFWAEKLKTKNEE